MVIERMRKGVYVRFLLSSAILLLSQSLLAQVGNDDEATILIERYRGFEDVGKAFNSFAREDALLADKQKARIYAFFADQFIEATDFHNADSCLGQASLYYGDSKNFEEQMEILHDRGILNMRIGQPENGQMYYQQSFEIAQRLESWSAAVSILTDMGRNLQILADYDSSEACLEQAMGLYAITHDDYLYARSKADYANTLAVSGKYEQALEAVNEAVLLLEAVDDTKNNRALNYSTKALIHRNLGQHQEATAAFQNAIASAQEASDSTTMIIVSIKFANYQSGQKNWEEVVRLCNHLESLPQAMRMQHVKHEILSLRADAYSELKNFELALSDYKQTDQIELDLQRDKRGEDVARAELLSLYDSNVRAAELRGLLAQRALDDAMQAKWRIERVWMIILIVALALMAFLLFRMQQQKNQLINQERELFENKMKEFSSEKEILALNSLIEGQELERTRIGKELHDRIGGLLSAVKLHFNVLEETVVNSDKLSDQSARITDILDRTISEVRLISHDLVNQEVEAIGIERTLQSLVESVRTTSLDVRLEMELPQAIDERVQMTMYRIVNEVLANAVKHAYATRIMVRIFTQTANLMIIITDDGIGMKTENLDNGLGIARIKERISAHQGSFELVHPNKGGLECHISLPLEWKRTGVLL